MQIFRKKGIRLILTFITGIIFLNMGFFLIEIKLLGLHKDRQLMENISKMIAGAAFEEERDCSVQSSGFAEEYMAGHHSNSHNGSYFLIAEYTSHLFNDGTAEHGYLKRFSPPPEI
jgi:hypothetical protein